MSVGSAVIQQDGDAKTLTAAVASARTTIPTRDSTGSHSQTGMGGASVTYNKPRRILVTAEFNSGLAGIHGANLRLGDGTITASGTDSVHLVAGESVLLFSGGHTHIAAIRTGGFDVVVHIVPLSD